MREREREKRGEDTPQATLRGNHAVSICGSAGYEQDMESTTLTHLQDTLLSVLLCTRNNAVSYAVAQSMGKIWSPPSFLLLVVSFSRSQSHSLTLTLILIIIHSGL